MHMMTSSPVRGIRLRPQPVGIFAPPVSLLLLPDRADRSALPELLSGNSQALLKDEWRFYRLALHGRPDDAAQLLATDATPVGQYNRFVLAPSLERYNALRAALPAGLACLLDAAAYTAGLIDTTPEPGAARETGLDGELLAMVLTVRAAWHMERDQREPASALLEEAIRDIQSVSPLFAAQLLHQLAALRRDTAPQQAFLDYREALRLAGDTPLWTLRAELWLHYGMALQDSAGGKRDVLLEAVKAYQEAIRAGLSLEASPEMYAMAHNNLALAFLAIPMRDSSDQLRMGIAVQSLREALKVYRRETHPELWSAAQLNLANALQYLPTSHPEENLAQAVEMYEDLLAVRSRALDPLGYARLLANQANALAHLGMFSPALEKMNEAYKLFHWHNETELAASALELVARINDRLGPGTQAEKG